MRPTRRGPRKPPSLAQVSAPPCQQASPVSLGISAPGHTCVSAIHGERVVKVTKRRGTLERSNDRLPFAIGECYQWKPESVGRHQLGTQCRVDESFAAPVGPRLGRNQATP
jgi:hypothetical protein